MRFRRLPILTSVVAVAAVSLLAAGCGGGSSPGVANVGSATSTSSSSSGGSAAAQRQQEIHEATVFARCIRSHGEPNFPDPNVAPHAFKDAFNNTPAFQAAYRTCGHLLPGGGTRNQSPTRSRAQIAALLAFARCLRTHGYPSFPDPTGSGELTREMLATARIDLHQPALVAAADRCTSVTHGVITRAVVAHFVAGH